MPSLDLLDLAASFIVSVLSAVSESILARFGNAVWCFELSIGIQN
jgi:hypothetical protein